MNLRPFAPQGTELLFHSVHSAPDTLSLYRRSAVVPLRVAEEVLTVREIAAILKVVPATVYAMLERGQPISE